MKTDKNGNLILTGVDTRIGNFVYSNHSQYVSLADIGSLMTFRISKDTLCGRALADRLKEFKKSGSDNYLTYFAVMMFKTSLCVYDVDGFLGLSREVDACIERHPDLYGGTKEPLSDEEDAKIVEEEKELHEAVESLKEDLENEES